MSTRAISLRDFDWLMFGILLAISTMGILQIYSTTANTPFAGAHQKQIVWLALGVTVMFCIMRVKASGVPSGVDSAPCRMKSSRSPA